MDSFLSLPCVVTNPEIINNIELLQCFFSLFGLDEDSFVCFVMPFVIFLPPSSPRWQQSNKFGDKCPHCCCWPVEDGGRRERSYLPQWDFLFPCSIEGYCCYRGSLFVLLKEYAHIHGNNGSVSPLPETLFFNHTDWWVTFRDKKYESEGQIFLTPYRLKS